MFGAVDATLRPLKIPSKFVPYMEKHRIYELFHELATGLIIQQPLDHILYLKQSLKLAARKRDSPRLILLGEPYVKMRILAESLQKKMALRPITLADIRNVLPETSEETIGEQEIVRNLIVILKDMASDYTGWVLVVDFNAILEQARLQESPLGKTLKMIEFRWGKRPEAYQRIRVVERSCRVNSMTIGSNAVDIVVLNGDQLFVDMFICIEDRIVTKYLLGRECTKRGWVLTGYPITLEDFELLDTSLPTPPNRVVFVSVKKETLLARLVGDRHTATSHSEMNLDSITSTNCFEANEFVLRSSEHDKRMIERDLEEYEKSVNSLLTYAGESGTVVDGNVDERILIERIEACLMRPAPCAPPRHPRVERKIEPLEFEPDDRPDHRIFDELRKTESIFSFM